MVNNPYLYAMKRPFVRGTTPVRGLTITMVANYLLNGMILQVCPPGNGHINRSPPKACLKILHIRFPRWDMLVPWRVDIVDVNDYSLELLDLFIR